MSAYNPRLIEQSIYRFKIESRITGLLMQLELRRIRAVGSCGGNDDTLFDVISDASERGIISEEEKDEVLDSQHTIFRGENREDRSLAYAIASISATVEDSHVNRAAAAADALQRATGVPVIPAVVGARISDACRELAAERGVTLIHVSFERVKMIDVFQGGI